MKTIYKYVFITSFLCSHFVLIAQLESDQQDIIKDFEATLEDANMVQIKPIVTPVVAVKKSYNYNLTIVPLEIKYPDPVIKPLAAEPDEAFDTKSFYAKLGYGNISNPFLNIKYFTTDQNKRDFFIDLFHNSLDNTKNKENQKMADSKGKIGLNYRVRENQLLTAVVQGGLEQRIFNANLPPQIKPEFFGETRNIFRGGLDVGLSNISPTEKGVLYNLEAAYQLVNVSKQDATELNATLSGAINKKIGKWYLTVPLIVSSNIKKEIKSLSTINLALNMSKCTDKLYLDFGLGLNYDTKDNLKLWPLVLVDYSIKSKYLHAFIQSKQEVSTNNLNHLLTINPWMYNSITAFSNNIAQSASFGVKGEANHLGYEGELGYKKVFNQATFTNLELDERSNLSLVDLNAVFVKGNIDFALSTNVKIGGQMVKNFYDKNAFGLYSFELTAYSNIDLFKDFLQLRPSLTLRDRSNNILKTSGEVKGNNQVELNIGSQLQFSDKFGLYLDAINLLNNQYVPFVGYPTVGIHFNGGVLLRI